MIENKFKKAIFAKDLDFDVSNYMDWMNDDDDFTGYLIIDDLDYQLESLQDSSQLDKDLNPIESDDNFMSFKNMEEFIKLYKFCKTNQIDIVIL